MPTKIMHPTRCFSESFKESLYDIYKSGMTKFGDIYYATEPPKCKASNIRRMMEVIKPGDILARGYDAYLDGKFIPGTLTHSGICINERQAIHSIAEGACTVDIIDFVKDTDRFAILRPRYPVDAIPAIDRAIWHVDENKTEYDFLFSEAVKYYCHELTADCLAKAGVIVSTTEMSFGVWPVKFKRIIYLADSFLEVSNVVYSFNALTIPTFPEEKT